jgi:predicted lysophospholipase L1 biosynthesis ABC-type transport system permease subunit
MTAVLVWWWGLVRRRWRRLVAVAAGVAIGVESLDQFAGTTEFGPLLFLVVLVTPAVAGDRRRGAEVALLRTRGASEPQLLTLASAEVITVGVPGGLLGIGSVMAIAGLLIAAAVVLPNWYGAKPDHPLWIVFAVLPALAARAFGWTAGALLVLILAELLVRKGKFVVGRGLRVVAGPLADVVAASMARRSREVARSVVVLASAISLGAFGVLAASGLVVALGLTARRDQFVIIRALGGARRQVRAFVAAEILSIVVGGVVAGSAMAWAEAVIGLPPPVAWLGYLAIPVVAVVSTVVTSLIGRDVLSSYRDT